MGRRNKESGGGGGGGNQIGLKRVESSQTLHTCTCACMWTLTLWLFCDEFLNPGQPEAVSLSSLGLLRDVLCCPRLLQKETRCEMPCPRSHS